MKRLSTAVQLGRIDLPADISIPQEANGLVIFAHGSGSSRLSPRNRRVAQFLNQGGLGTMLIDLLTAKEERVDLSTAELRFDIGLLGRRMAAITEWIGSQPDWNGLRIGYFGASTGAAAALVAAAERPEIVRATVSRGGRPDLAGESLPLVQAPTLFIVGGEDRVVLGLNESAMARLPGNTERKLEVIEGAGHLFEEPGALERVADLALNWFRRYL